MLSLAALIYIVTGINTDLFVWVKDYVVSLKDDDSAVNAKVSPLSTDGGIMHPLQEWDALARPSVTAYKTLCELFVPFVSRYYV